MVSVDLANMPSSGNIFGETSDLGYATIARATLEMSRSLLAKIGLSTLSLIITFSLLGVLSNVPSATKRPVRERLP